MKIEIAEPGRMTQSGSSLLKLIQNNDMPVLDLLVRESVQNSLDAGKKSGKFVEMNFITGNFNAQGLADKLEGITVPLKKKYPKASYPFLAVQDRNTVGLTGVMDYKKVKNNEYGNLLKLVYEICKPQQAEGAGGSWGIGKTVYFRLGIGMVIYYSRIWTNGKYESRLAASLVEDENSKSALIPEYKGQTKRGIAWWGEETGENITQPVTDDKEIEEFLKLFGIAPYEGEETGTTIIIPFIDSEKLLLSNQIEYAGQKTPYWTASVEEYLKVAVQRWYAPRLNNRYYSEGAYLRVRINGEGLALDDMEPAFQVIQALYNRANHVSGNDILSANGADVQLEPIKIIKYLTDQVAGTLAFTKVTRAMLRMTAPHNKPDPFMYFNCEVRDQDVNRPTVCFTRKPAMIVSYENVGPWASHIASTSKEEYILAIFVLNSWNRMKNGPTERSLEEYIRRSEMADHTSWSDWSEGSYNPRIVAKIQNKVDKTIEKAYAGSQAEKKPVENSGLSKLFGDLLLPPDGFGKKPGPGPGPGPDSKPAKKSGITYHVDAGGIRYGASEMIIPVEIKTSAKKKISEAGALLQIDSESKKISMEEWEGKMSMPAPFAVTGCEFESLKIDGVAQNSFSLDSSHPEKQVQDMTFRLRYTPDGTAYGAELESGEKHGLSVRILFTVQLNRRDVKPSFMFEKEKNNG